MAHTLKITQTGISIGGLLSSIGEYIFSAMMKVAEANSRSKEIEFLRALSDEDLAKRGLTRDRIVQHVFADRMVF